MIIKKISKARRLFAQNMKKIRLEQGISQEKLAELAGVHRTYIGSVERCERNIAIDNMQNIADALSVSVVKLLSDD